MRGGPRHWWASRRGCFLNGRLRRTDFLPVGEEAEDEELERGCSSASTDPECGVAPTRGPAHDSPHAFEEKPGKHAASETRIWKEKEGRMASGAERPTWTQQRQATRSIWTLYKSCAPVGVKTPEATKMVLERYSECDS